MNIDTTKFESSIEKVKLQKFYDSCKNIFIVFKQKKI